MTLVMVVFWGSLTIWSVQSAPVTCPHACQNTKEVAGVQGWNGEAFPSILYSSSADCWRSATWAQHQTCSSPGLWHLHSSSVPSLHSCYPIKTKFTASTRALGCCIRDTGSEAALAFIVLIKKGRRNWREGIAQQSFLTCYRLQTQFYSKKDRFPRDLKSSTWNRDLNLISFCPG